MGDTGTDCIMSRVELDRILARHPAVGSEPRQDIFQHLGVHPDRFKLRSLPMEAKVWAKSMLRHDSPKPFLIYGRPRSGTTLLVHLLNQIPGLRCDGELLHYFLLSPLNFLRRLPKRAGSHVQAYGVKVLSYQLMEIQRIRRPIAFFDALGNLGYDIVHLTRNSWDQTLSLIKAQESGLYFDRNGTSAVPLRLDPCRFVDLLQWNERMLDYEEAVMSHVKHFRIQYDSDLKEASSQQKTIDALCRHLGITSSKVNSAMRRTGGNAGLQKVENMEELMARVSQSDLAHLVPKKPKV